MAYFIGFVLGWLVALTLVIASLFFMIRSPYVKKGMEKLVARAYRVDPFADEPVGAIIGLRTRAEKERDQLLEQNNLMGIDTPIKDIDL